MAADIRQSDRGDLIITIGTVTLIGGGACPEQYDAFVDDKMVGYFRLRHGRFTVENWPGGKLIYEANPSGDGLFEYDERIEYLTNGVVALLRELRLR